MDMKKLIVTLAVVVAALSVCTVYFGWKEDRLISSIVSAVIILGLQALTIRGGLRRLCEVRSNVLFNLNGRAMLAFIALGLGAILMGFACYLDYIETGRLRSVFTSASVVVLAFEGVLSVMGSRMIRD